MGKTRYSISKSRSILKSVYSFYKDNVKKLSSIQKDQLEEKMKALDNAILEKDVDKASILANDLENLQYVRKTASMHVKEIIFALLFALVLATVARQMWFEMYQIPTGSMRPTFREKDRIIVSKTDFSVNVPLTPKNFYFNPKLVKRGNTIVFTVENMDMRDPNTKYLYIFPGKKRLIKRCMGLPGDTIYFYGGQVYGIDASGNEILLRYDPYLQGLDYIPIISFMGKISPGANNALYFKQMNEVLAKLSLKPGGLIDGDIFVNGKWKEEVDASQRQYKPDFIQTYGDFWGINNYGMARLLTRKQLEQLTDVNINGLEDTEFYLEINHDPSLSYPKIKLSKNIYGNLFPKLVLNKSIIPLQKRYIEKILQNMYTSRFVVKNGRAFRYYFEKNLNRNVSSMPFFADVEDGMYEFYHGNAYKVGLQGILSKLPQEHPLYNLENVQNLFNLGIEFNNFYDPEMGKGLPSRYAYFREGDLYLLGNILMDKNDPTLLSYNQREENLMSEAPINEPYIPFLDRGVPLREDGTIDVDFIKTFGLKIPENMYLALGDNHAMSSDSRDFGFVPGENLRGSANFILWPPGSRWGTPSQNGYSLFCVPRIIVWTIVALLLIICFVFVKIRNKKPIFKKIG